MALVWIRFSPHSCLSSLLQKMPLLVPHKLLRTLRTVSSLPLVPALGRVEQLGCQWRLGEKFRERGLGPDLGGNARAWIGLGQV